MPSRGYRPESVRAFERSPARLARGWVKGPLRTGVALVERKEEKQRKGRRKRKESIETEGERRERAKRSNRNEAKERMCVHAAHVACQPAWQPPWTLLPSRAGMSEPSAALTRSPSLFLSRSFFVSSELQLYRRKGIFLFIKLQPLTWSTPTHGPTCGTTGTPQQVRDYRVSCAGTSFVFFFFFFSFLCFLLLLANSNGSGESTRESDRQAGFIENCTGWLNRRGSVMVLFVHFIAFCTRSGWALIFNNALSSLVCFLIEPFMLVRDTVNLAGVNYVQFFPLFSFFVNPLARDWFR